VDSVKFPSNEEKIAIHQVQIKILEERLDKMEESLKSISDTVHQVNNKLSMYEGKFGGFIMTVLGIGGIIGWGVQIIMSYIKGIK